MSWVRKIRKIKKREKITSKLAKSNPFNKYFIITTIYIILWRTTNKLKEEDMDAPTKRREPQKIRRNETNNKDTQNNMKACAGVKSQN